MLRKSKDDILYTALILSDKQCIVSDDGTKELRLLNKNSTPSNTERNTTWVCDYSELCAKDIRIEDFAQATDSVTELTGANKAYLKALSQTIEPSSEETWFDMPIYSETIRVNVDYRGDYTVVEAVVNFNNTSAIKYVILAGRVYIRNENNNMHRVLEVLHVSKTAISVSSMSSADYHKLYTTVYDYVAAFGVLQLHKPDNHNMPYIISRDGDCLDIRIGTSRLGLINLDSIPLYEAQLVLATAYDLINAEFDVVPQKSKCNRLYEKLVEFMVDRTTTSTTVTTIEEVFHNDGSPAHASYIYESSKGDIQWVFTHIPCTDSIIVEFTRNDLPTVKMSLPRYTDRLSFITDRESELKYYLIDMLADNMNAEIDDSFRSTLNRVQELDITQRNYVIGKAISAAYEVFTAAEIEVLDKVLQSCLEKLDE